MAGHSKWSNIKHRKGAQDAARGKIFTKLAKEIAVAAKLGGDDLASNSRLRAVVTKARAASMPKDNIERAIKKGVGNTDMDNFAEKTYEGYGPGGVAIMVECLTDNTNRTVSDVRYSFNKFGGNLGTDGSVSWMFQAKGYVVYEKTAVSDYDRLLEVALEGGAEDVADADGAYEITCPPAAFETLKAALDELGIEPSAAEVTRLPENQTAVDEKQAESLTKLIEALEDNDDVQNVYHNALFPG